MTISKSRRILPGIVLIAGLMAVAMAMGCGGAASAPASVVAESEVASDAPQDVAQGTAGAPGSHVPPSQPRAAATAAPAAASAPVRQQSESADSSATAMSGATSGSAGDGSVTSQAESGRQLIVEAWISLEVDEIDSAVRHVETVAAQRNGWVESADIVGEGGYRTASVNVRVPAGRFNNAMETFRSLGRVTDEGVSSTDVTDRLIDNEARLAAWTTQEERLIVLLENAATVEDVIDIERRIAEVRADIEHVAATQRNLENRVAASLIRVNLHLPQRFAAEPPHGSLTIAVGDPRGTANTVSSRVETLNGYIGEKIEYQEGRGQVVELSAYVRPRDLAGLMDYAATTGEPSNRQLNSVGPAPAGEVPNARLRLIIRSNVDSAASLSLAAANPIPTANEIRAQAESLGGYVESWNESRYDRGEHENIHMELVVRASDIRDIMDFGSKLGEAEAWEYRSVGDSPTDAAPNARLTISVYTADENAFVWLYIVAIVVGVISLVAVIAVVVWVSRRQSERTVDIATADVPVAQDE